MVIQKNFYLISEVYLNKFNYLACDLEVGKLLVDNEAGLKVTDRKGYKANDITAGDCGYDGNEELSLIIYGMHMLKNGDIFKKWSLI